MKRSILLITFTLLLFGCSKQEDNSQQNAYSANLIKNFTAACTATGGKPDYCVCVVNDLSNHLSEKEYIELESSMIKTGVMPEKLANALSKTIYTCSPPATDNSNHKNYSAALVENFTNACIKSGGEASYCLCMINQISYSLPQEEYLHLESSYTAKGVMPEKMANALSKAMATCSANTESVPNDNNMEPI